MFDLATTLRQVGIRQRSLRSHCRLGRATELVFVLATGATVLIGGAAVAADIDWDAGAPADTSTDPATGGADTWVEGGTTFLWNDGTNNVDFKANDNVTFGAANPVGTYDVTLGGSVTTTNLTFGATGVTITDATSGNTLSVVGQVILSGAGIGSFIKAPVTGNLATNVDTGSILNLSGTVSGTVQTLGAGLVDIVGGVGGLNSDAGTVRINGSGANTGAVSGTTTIDDSTVQVQSGSLSAASTVTVTGATSVLDVDGGTVGAVTINSGTLDADGGIIGSLDLNAGATHSVAGTAQVTGATTIDSATLAQTGGTLNTVTVGTSGTLDVSGGAVSGLVTNAGVINAGGGALNGGLTNGGTINANGNTTTFALAYTNINGITNTGDTTSTLSFGNTFANTGTVAAGNGSVTIQAANIAVGAGTAITGTVSLEGNLSGSADLGGANVTGSVTIADGDSVTGVGTFTNTNTTISNIGAGGAGGVLTASSITNQNGATINVNANSTLTGTGNTTNNSGIVSVAGGGSLVEVTGDYNNLGTGIVNFNDAGAKTFDVQTGVITNAGALNFNAGTTTVNSAGGAIQNNAGGTINVDNGATMDATGDTIISDGAGAIVTVEGTLTVTSVTNQNGAQLIVNDDAGALTTGAISGAVINTSDFDLNGGSVGSLANNAGTSDLNGGTVAGATTVADGTVTNAGATLTGAASTSGTGIFTQTAGAANGGIANNGGMVNLNGGTAATLANNAGAGTSTVTNGQVTGTTTIADGAVVVNGTADGTAELAGTTTLTGGTLTVTDGDVAGLVNQGTTGTATEITVTAGNVASLTNTSGEALLNGGTVAGATTVADGTVTNAGATLTGAASTSGTGIFTQTAGAANGGIANNGGMVNLNGGTAGSFTGNSSTTFMTGGSITGLSTINAGTFNFIGGTLGDVANNGTFNFGSTVAGNFTNTGTLNATGATGVITGNLSAPSGTINMQNGDATSLLTVNGNADLNGLVQLDVDLSDGSTLSDTIAVGGALSGDIALAFNNIGTEGDISDIDIFTYGTTNSLSFNSITGLPDTAVFEYFVQDNGAGSVLLQSRINTGITNLAATVGLTQTLVDAVINRPTSPFVSDFAGDKTIDPCGAGTWARMTGGSADVDGSFSDETTGQTGTSPVSLNYSGLQLGGDFACFDGHYDGWDLAFGGLLGVNQGNTSNNVFAIDPNTGAATTQLLSFTETDILQRYAGVYMTAARGRFFGDLQYRYEATRFSSTNFEVVANRGFDLTDEKYENRGQTVSGAVGYSWPVGDIPGLSFVSSAGFAFTNNQTDTIDLGTDGTLTLKDSKSRIGFISGTLAKSKLLDDEVSILSYFGTATLYNDFGSDREAVFTSPSGTVRDLKISNVGSYGEVSAGLNYVRLLSPNDAGGARQLNAAIRVDARVGADIDSYALTGQLRLQF